MIGILYCHKSTIAYEELKQILLANGIPATCIAIEDATAHSFDSVSVIMNVMGSFCPEEKIEMLVDFFNSGKNIINLCATPFTKNLGDGKLNNRMLRSFGIIDDFSPITENSAYVKTPAGEKLHVTLTGLCSSIYRLCERSEDGETLYSAHLEPILEAFDSDNRLIATPIIRIITHKKGSMSFLSFDFDTAMLKETFWKNLFLDLVKKELLGNILLSVDCSFSRYYPEEEKKINICLTNINTKVKSDISLSLTIYDGNHAMVFRQEESVSLPYETTLLPKLTDSSLYQITATVSINGTMVTQTQTGFLVISDEEISEELDRFKPMYIDESIATDFCVVDGKPTAILGSTYFVTDVYRKCFYDMNAWLCAKEMAQLKKVGFNTLRSGNWCYIDEFYQEDGSISERGKRALQTYFFLAAKNGFTVQFTLGTVLLNQWNTNLSPIHNSQMRQKCMTYVRSFAEAFKFYTNVVLDIVNEPSYSYEGAWSTGRPSYQEGEILRYRQWLYDKYDGKIENLRSSWGESAMTIRCFDDITMPAAHLFARELSRTQQMDNHVPIVDFYAFSRDEFLTWITEIRANVKQVAPDMPVIMGIDENLRVPEQQTELLAGNTDMVCFHQWNHNSNIMTEYLLNHVRGKIFVAQELGVYRFENIRSGKRHTDYEIAVKLEKKLLYSFGNFIQWQTHDDPFLFELCENSLGLFRADHSPTPAVLITQKLIASEKNMQNYMFHRQNDKVKIATVYSTSYHYNVDNSMAKLGITNHVYALYHCLKEQSDFILENLFQPKNSKTIGSPKLIILPAMQMLNKDVWKHLLTYVKNGAVLLVNGCIDKDEYFADDSKIGNIDNSYITRKLKNFEKLTIGETDYTLDFRAAAGYVDVSNLFHCGQVSNGNTLTHYALGNGTILYCPYPIELSTNYEAICACYEYAIKLADAKNDIYRITNARPHIIFTAASYENCTVYTMINEGFEDTISFTDLRSGVSFSALIKEERGCKLWISTSGEVLQVYGEVCLSYEK